MRVIILMGSPADRPFVEKITAALERFELPYVTHVASAHKIPRHALELLDRYEAEGGPRVYITVAGRSNALSGFVDAQVTAPVIACPPYSDSFGGADIWSSLRMPSGVAPAVVLEPANAALLAAKILRLEEQVAAAQQAARERLLDEDDRRPTTDDR
jgi:5-(carboxyamino)imidazole ribonucleotide mutase/phosphoribosylaminoimidazole-succinocarboxamide synthase